jgi:hypothetical protein
MHIIFVKWGNKYSASHVNNLHNSLKSYQPNYRYYCLTDDSNGLNSDIEAIKLDPKLHLKGVWAKLFMFSDSFPIKGNIQYFDLDTVIQSDPFTIDINWDKLTVVDCHWKPKNIVRINNYDVTINSSILAWNSNNPQIPEIWSKFNNGYRDYYLRKYVGIDRFIVHEGFEHLFDYFPHDYVMSYKYEQRKDAPVVTFEELSFERADFIPVSQSN